MPGEALEMPDNIMAIVLLYRPRRAAKQKAILPIAFSTPQRRIYCALKAR